MTRSTRSANPLSQANPTEFASAVTHGLRQPLAALRASLESWTKTDPTGSSEDASGSARVDRTLGEVARLARSVQALAEWADPTVLLPLDCTAEEIARSVVRARSNARERIQLVCTDDPHLLYVDGPILTRSLIRLLDNALEAGSGPVLFRTTYADGAWTFAIVEAGRGFGEPLDELERPFHTNKPGALGIGLPLARRDIERIGGHLDVRRTALGHTLTTVTVPLRAEEAA